MSVRVATALSDTDFEHRLAQRLAKADTGAHLVRRCLDLIELRSVAGAHLVDVVVVDPGMRGFDRDVVGHLHSLGVRVVGVVATAEAGVETSQGLGQGFGVDAVVPADDALVCLALRGGVTSHQIPQGGSDGASEGRVVAVWGPLGSPGRTTLATAIADEISRTECAVLLADADSYGASVAQQLGLLDDASGLAAACRLAGAGRLDAEGLQRCTVALPGGMRVLTGIAKPDRWDELRPASLETVWQESRRSYAVTVVDVGFCVEHDEFAGAEGIQPQRNQASVSTLRTADTVIAVADSSPVGLVRFIRDLTAVRSLAPTAQTLVVANRVAKRDEASVTALLKYQLGVEAVQCLPPDSAVVEAWRSGLMLSERSRRSALQKAIGDMATEIVGRPSTKHRRRIA